MSAGSEVVKVLYDYKYCEDTDEIEIRTGDVYKLIDKTNDEWWQVYDPSSADGESFFVPAKYVEIVPHKMPWKSSANKTFIENSAVSSNISSEDEEYEEDLSYKSPGRVVVQRTPGKDDIKNNEIYVNSASKLLSTKGDGDYVNLDQYREAANIKNTTAECISGSSDRDPPPRSLIKPSAVSLTSVEGSAPLPVPENGKFVRILTKDMPWDVYKDTALGRLYYVNRETGERLWKPPRKVILPLEQLSLASTAPSAQVRKERSVDVSAECNQVQENGSIHSTQKSTQEKQDVNWESQGHQLSTFGGHSLRAAKTMSAYSQLETDFRSQLSVLPANFPSVRTIPPASEHSESPNRVLNLQLPTNHSTPHSTCSLRTHALEDVHEGYLYKTMILDVSRKKVKKSWTQIYVVLQGSNLVFYKDQKSVTQKQGCPYGTPETVVSLQGARVDLNPKDLTNKKNTISLRVSAGNVYLFQSESEKENLEWFTRMKIVANDVSPTDPSPKDLDVQEVKKDKGMIRSASADDSTNLHNVDRINNMIRIRVKLLNLISRRPTQEDLYKRGIIKDAVFGSRLHELCDREQVNVPHFVHKCIAAVESRGITHDGLYRLSGNMAEIQRLRCTVDTADSYNLYDEQWDINVLTGALKMFFRELKEPVFTFHMYDRFIDAVKIESRKEKLAAFRSAVKHLPRCNHATLKELFRHLHKVMEASHKNRMQSLNISIVFGPTLLWQQHSTEDLAVQTMYQNKIVEFILVESTELFP